MQAKDASDLISWKSQISVQLDHLLQDNAILRWEFIHVFRNFSLYELIEYVEIIFKTVE